MEDIYDEDSSRTPQQLQGAHVIVLVHGFQGNSSDLLLIRNELAALFPDHFFLLSAGNEGNTRRSIAEMGYNLASEVIHFLQ